MDKKYYAVRNGKKKGIFDSWKDCQEQVKGFKGAEFKSFFNKEDAELYIKNINNNTTFKTDSIAYVDGSYNSLTKEFSYGIVFFYKNKTLYFNKKFNDENLASMRNVAGEIKGSESIIDFAIKKNIKSISIYYDFEGIRKWALGEWKTNKEGTKLYAEFCKEAMKKIKIQFIKIKSHSGNKYNDLADCLAKEAVELNKEKLNIKIQEL